MTIAKAPVSKPDILRGRTEKFTMRHVPLLSQGATTTPIVICENLTIASKVYAEGGENALHRHLKDDHAFFVLAGKANFYDEDGNLTEVGPLEGMVVPRGTAYRFESVPPENLVILRVEGAAEDYYSIRAKAPRRAADGSELHGSDPRNGTPSLGAVENGEFFGD